MSEGEAAKPGEGEAEPDEPSRPAWVGWLFTLAKLGLAAALLGWILSKDEFDWSKLGGALTSRYMVMVALLATVGLSMSGVRWQFLLRAEGIRVGLWTAVKLTWIGHFWNMVIPGAVSGDAVKMYYIGQVAPERREEAWTTVLADRAIGLCALVGVAAVASLLRFEFMWQRTELRLLLLTMIFVLACFLVGGLVIMTGLGREWALTAWAAQRLPEKLRGLIGRVYGSLHRTARNPKTVAATLAISVLAHSIAVANAYLLGQALEEKVLSFSQYATAVPVALFSNAIPLTPGGGVGVGEAVIGKLFEWFGGSSGKGGMVMLAYRVNFFLLAGVGAALYAFYRSHDPRLQNLEEGLGEAETPQA
ncbi:MAG TPA: hypothetical protein DEA08_14965 [Planctomycetes bacterium]|nr:hypothetical protein [Planctomycetota bacterium]